jgi:hypothetical protein
MDAADFKMIFCCQSQIQNVSLLLCSNLQFCKSETISRGPKAVCWGAPRLSAVPPALPRPEGHPDLSVPLEPCHLFMERHRSETTVLGNSFIIVDKPVQSSLVSK